MVLQWVMAAATTEQERNPEIERAKKPCASCRTPVLLITECRACGK